jgi:hypothetical protein
MLSGLCFVEVKVRYTHAKKNVNYEISCKCTKLIGKVVLQSCPKMFEIKKKGNATCEGVYPRHRHHLFHDLDDIFVAFPWPW